MLFPSRHIENKFSLKVYTWRKDLKKADKKAFNKVCHKTSKSLLEKKKEDNVYNLLWFLPEEDKYEWN